MICVPALLCLLGHCAVSKIREWRTRRLMDAISAHLAGADAGKMPLPLPTPASSCSLGSSAQMARLTENINATIGLASRLGWFASDLAHELRTPLTAVRAELEEAVTHQDGTGVAGLAGRTLPSLDRAEAVVRSMLTLARMETYTGLDRERVDLGDLVEQEVNRRRDRLTVKVRLAETVVVTAVREQIRQATTNLLDNAQRHARHHVEVEVRRQAGLARLVVDDDGDGVPEADRLRVFDRFARLNRGCRNGDGAGLGLSITRAIAEAHGGGVHVEDSPAGGARFVLRLPLA